MRINPYLTFDGHCEEAFTLYAEVLGGRITARFTYGESPEPQQATSAARDKIMHMRLEVGDQALMGSDCPAEYPYEKVQGCHVSLNIDGVAEAERIYQALSANGTVQMPIQKTFWAERFGMFVDRFGVPWMVNCDRSG